MAKEADEALSFSACSAGRFACVPEQVWEAVEGTELRGALAAPRASLPHGHLAGFMAPTHGYSLKVLAEQN